MDTQVPERGACSDLRDEPLALFLFIADSLGINILNGINVNPCQYTGGEDVNLPFLCVVCKVTGIIHPRSRKFVLLGNPCCGGRNGAVFRLRAGVRERFPRYNR